MNDLDLDTTMARALSEAERTSIAAAAEAMARGEIKQREVVVGSGVWTLVKEEQ